MDADLSASFNVDDLLDSQYGKVHASGRLKIDTLKAYSKPLGMDILYNKCWLLGRLHPTGQFLSGD